MKISDEAIADGLKKACMSGRFDLISRKPAVILDGAHNIDAAGRLAENVNTYLQGKKITAVLGIFKDKEYKKIIRIMAPYISTVYPVELPNADRTLSKEELKDELKKYPVTIKDVDSLEEAIDCAVKGAQQDEVILVFGSLSHLAEAKSLVEGRTVKNGR